MNVKNSDRISGGCAFGLSGLLGLGYERKTTHWLARKHNDFKSLKYTQKKYQKESKFALDLKKTSAYKTSMHNIFIASNKIAYNV